MAEVESFTLDHTAVKAPYVRLITVEEGPKGDQISNFDLRLVQPNENAIPQPVFLISDLRVALHVLYINIRSAYELNTAPDTAGIAVLPVSGLTTWPVHGLDHMPFDLGDSF